MLAFGDVGRPTVDKHSTGGVGDKITLPLAPLVAACGAAVPQLSGRGLGHTGGTLDKLESIPGWRAALSAEEIAAQLADVGAVICATTPTLAPADRKLYALRDVTGTVESIPLIASSIMSKKIAEGTGGLVLDVKVGSGAFMKRARPGRASWPRRWSGSAPTTGLPTVALLTDMSVPLGRAVGNALEVAESVEVLRGGGPADVVALTVALAREMLALAGLSDVDPAEVLASGAAVPVWERMIAAQGGDPAAALPMATHVEPVLADRPGVLAGCDALAVGVAAWRLGAGRARQSDAVQAAAGVRLLVELGRAGRGRAAAAGAAHRHPGRRAGSARRARRRTGDRRRGTRPSRPGPRRDPPVTPCRSEPKCSFRAVRTALWLRSAVGAGGGVSSRRGRP